MVARLKMPRVKTIEARFPSYFETKPNSPQLEEMIGATILAIGAPDCGEELEGGGFAIRYRLPDGSEKTLLVAFNELGMWTADDY
jgi:hypothetical protein